MGAYDCIWGTSWMLFKHLVGNKHGPYCTDLLNSIAIGLHCYDIVLSRCKCKYVPTPSWLISFVCFEKLFVYLKILLDILNEYGWQGSNG